MFIQFSNSAIALNLTGVKNHAGRVQAFRKGVEKLNIGAFDKLCPKQGSMTTIIRPLKEVNIHSMHLHHLLEYLKISVLSGPNSHINSFSYVDELVARK